MKRIYIRLVVGLIISLFFVGLGPHIASAGVNDFSFNSFDADYYLSKDSDGHSTMKVVENLTAEFSNLNQNKGIERAVPNYYDGHTLDFKLVSLTRNGLNEPVFDQKQNGKEVVVSTGTDEYVNGTQIYTFTYTLRDVTKTFGDHQELYWDTNGTKWLQTFDKLTVRVHLDKSVKENFNGDVSCYEGTEGSNTKCTGEVNAGVVSFSSNGSLNGGENLTFNLSFKADTFASYQMTLLDFLPYVLIGFSVPLFLITLFIKWRYGRNNPGKGTIIAQYLPPKNVSVLFSAEIFNKVQKSSTAQIIDLAVRHKIKIIETEKKILFTKNPKYTLEIINVDGLDDNELEFLNILFKGHQIGSTYTLNKSDTARGRALYILNNTVKEQTEEYGFRKKQSRLRVLQWLIIIAIFALIGAAGYVFLDTLNDIGLFAAMVSFLVFITVILTFKIYSIRPLTEKGRELFDYLKGLEVYIKLAEADRLKVLQSPSGAEKKPVDTTDTAKMVVLYERVLPYAVLFGQEKQWVKQLGFYYENGQTSPGWYSGVGAFNAAAFASSFNSFSNYAGSSSFSSSSGAGGGGSSGGGGGGGGGGGR